MHRKLRNADAALQLLASFHGTEDSGPLAAQLLAKTTEILAQYARELDSASGQFRAGKVRGKLARVAPYAQHHPQDTTKYGAVCLRAGQCFMVI